MIDNNLLLYLPFDDPEGATAYDFSKNRADAALSEGATLSRGGKAGKALALNGEGECLTAQTIPFGGNFTLTMWAKTPLDKLGWLLSMPGVNKYEEQWLEVAANEWTFLCFVKDGLFFYVYKNGNLIDRRILDGTPNGFSVNDTCITGSNAELDDIRLYNVAKPQIELLKLQQGSDVEYFIDGRNFKDMGVFVSGSKGIIGQLARKESLQVDWDNYHGIARDKSTKYYKERTITLDCFIECNSRDEYVQRVNDFFACFDALGNHRLKIDYNGNVKPLVYEVELHNEVDTNKRWGLYYDASMVGTFSLKLVEDEPVKRVCRHIGANANSVASFTISSPKMLNIYWGDGTHTYNVRGNNQTITHTYTSAGEYDIVIAGVIEDITDFTTNTIVLWELLK